MVVGNHHPIGTEIWQGGAIFNEGHLSINGTVVRSNNASGVSEEKRTTDHHPLTTELPLPLHDFGNASRAAAESTVVGLSLTAVIPCGREHPGQRRWDCAIQLQPRVPPAVSILPRVQGLPLGPIRQLLECSGG